MKNKGISLIVLIITIVVIIILATAIIVNLVDTNIINNANEAVAKSRAKNVEEAINLWEMEKFMSNVSDESSVKTLGEMLDELESQKLITAEERKTIESTGKIEIGSKTLEFAKIHEIGTKEDLEKFRDNVDNGNTYKNEIVKLTANIDLQGNANDESTWWNPIGSLDRNICFEGIFDGNGFCVSNMYSQVENRNFDAFFARIKNATIKNLTVSGNVISLPQISEELNPAAAGMIGIAMGKCNITNCINEVNVKKTSTGREIAGVLGCAELDSDVTMVNCVNKGTIEGSNACAGLVGSAYGNLTVNNCYNEGEISNPYGNYAAGLVARNCDGNTYVSITNSYNIGNISAKRNIGGILGYLGNEEEGELYINNCYNSGEIKSYERTAVAYFGGIVGRSNQAGKTVKILNCYNTTDIITATSTKNVVIGGIIGEISNSSGEIINCYNLGNLEGDYAGGIMGLLSGTGSGSTILKMSNAYNAGSITGRLYTSGIVRVHYNGATAEFKNTYCLDTAANVLVDNYTTDGVVSKDDTYMKSENFAKELNNNIKQMTEEKGLKEWKYNEGSYPTL